MKADYERAVKMRQGGMKLAEIGKILGGRDRHSIWKLLNEYWKTNKYRKYHKQYRNNLSNPK